MCLTPKQYTEKQLWEHIVWKHQIKQKCVVEMTDYYDEYKDTLGQSDGDYLECMGAFKDSYDLSTKVIAFSKKHSYEKLKSWSHFTPTEYMSMNDEVEERLEEIEDAWDSMKKMKKEIVGFKGMGFKINYF
tara:strand:- start:1430 stop:1822 length:393 start_codon:yes stop_codon:yes gene_type:complete